MSTQELKAYELQKLINICYEAVDKSSVGPMLIVNDGVIQADEKGAPYYKQIAFSTFMTILTNLCPKANYSFEMKDLFEDKKAKNDCG